MTGKNLSQNRTSTDRKCNSAGQESVAAGTIWQSRLKDGLPQRSRETRRVDAGHEKTPDKVITAFWYSPFFGSARAIKAKDVREMMRIELSQLDENWKSVGPHDTMQVSRELRLRDGQLVEREGTNEQSVRNEKGFRRGTSSTLALHWSSGEEGNKCRNDVPKPWGEI